MSLAEDSNRVSSADESSLEVCMEDNIFWTDILTINPEFEFKVAIVSDVPFSSQGSAAPELSEF